MKLRTGILAVTICLFLAGTSAMASPVLNAGWTADQVDTAGTPSEGSPYLYNLGASAIFRVTDQFVIGDTYQVFDFGTLIMTTSFNGAQGALTPAGDLNGEAGWESADYSHGAVTLAAGLHSLVLEGDGAGGLPAGVYARIDSVPEASSLLMLGLGLAGLAVIGSIRKATNN